MSLKLKDVALATGSDCTSASVEPSHVIRALGFGDERAHNALRMSMGRGTTEKEVITAVNQIVQLVQ